MQRPRSGKVGGFSKTAAFGILSDVFFDSPEALLASSGFSLEHIEDMTEQWREYYFAALWSGETIGCPKTNLKCKYYLIICRKEMPDGSF